MITLRQAFWLLTMCAAIAAVAAQMCEHGALIATLGRHQGLEAHCYQIGFEGAVCGAITVAAVVGFLRALRRT